MMTLDFTKLELGSLVSRSRTIIRCPLCRRAGVLESRKDGSRRCIHVEVATNGGIVFEVPDRCDFAGPRAAVPAEETTLAGRI